MNGSPMIMLVLMVVVFYFFLIRPQQKKQKELKKFRENLKTGDKIVTFSGIHGKILELTDTTALISSDGTKLRIEKAVIAKQFSEQEAQQVQG
jgi:preprotein translocase subunit YajC